MQTVILVIHLMLAVALVAVVLLQRSEGGGLGMGGGSGGAGGGMGLMSARAAGNVLTRTTAILAAGFMITSITLAIMANSGRDTGASSVMDQAPATTEQPAAPDSQPADQGPAVPLSE